MIQPRENLRTDGRTEGRTDGQTLFHRTLPAEAGGPNLLKNHTFGITIEPALLQIELPLLFSKTLNQFKHGLHSQQGQFFGIHFLIDFLKLSIGLALFDFSRITFQIFIIDRLKSLWVRRS